MTTAAKIHPAAAAPQQHSSSCPLPESLIIIGAGVAGIKLAHHVLSQQQQHRDPEDNSNNITNMKITILEASDCIGGRLRSADFEGHTVELGANWISGLETKYQNPIWELAQSVHLSGHGVDRHEERAAQVVDSTTAHGTTNAADRQRREYFAARDRFEAAHAKAVKECARRSIITARSDVDVRSLLERCGWPAEQQLTAMEKLAEHNLLTVWAADSLLELSAALNLKEGATDVELGADEFFVEDPRGFRCILDGMVDDLRKFGAVIHLNTRVETVRYAPGHVSVVTCTTANSGGGATTKSKSTFTADAIVSTVSLGVLQSDQIEFVPPLPDWKTRALGEVGMFVFAKVFARFEDHEFWRRTTTKNQIIVCSDKKRGHYPLWMRYRNVADDDSILFMCYLGGPEAKRVESLTTEQIKDEIEELFRNAFDGEIAAAGDDDPRAASLFRPAAVAVTDWSRNPHFCGSYSVFPVHAFSSVPIEDLTAGLTGTDAREGRITLHFAGEAFDDLYNGWVQGAYRSGERVARSILGI